MTQEILLSVENLSRSFDNHTVIHNLSFKIHRGEVVALLGTNGAGKSTALNVITGNLNPDAGNVQICNIDIFTKPKQAKNNLGYLPDTPPLYRELNVHEFLEFAARLHGIERKLVKQSIEEVVDTCGLQSVQHKLISNLSKGYQQRVGIAQAVIHHPALVILDEPTIGLDPVQMQDIRTLLHKLSGDHSVLLSTHMLSEAESTCDRVLIINKGELLLDQALQDLNKNPRKRVKLRFRNNPTVEDLNSIAGCESVSCSQYGNFVCRYNNTNFIQHVQTMALRSNWQLDEIVPVASTLEQVFLDLVVRDSTTENTSL